MFRRRRWTDGTVILRTAKQLLGRDVALTWRFAVNAAPTVAHWRRPVPISPAGRQVLDDLRRRGVAVVDLASLLGHDPIGRELAAAVDALEDERADDVAEARRLATVRGGEGEKRFLLPLLGERPVLDLASPYARLAAHPALVAVANAYYGMTTRVREYHVWRSFVTGGAPYESQLWHRDWREDHLMLKAFLYLSDVPDSGHGPFVYAPGTHRKGRRSVRPATTRDYGAARASDRAMAAALPRDEWLEATGPAGTLVLADTTGWHRGGWPTTGERLLFTWGYGSRALPRSPRFSGVAATPATPEVAAAFGVAS